VICWRRIIRRCLLTASLASVPAISGFAVSAQSPVSTSDSCSKDYPVPTTAVNYEQAFASETLVPDQISVNSEILRPGGSEERLSRAIGAKSNIIENPVERSDSQQCDYLLELLRNHPNSMYLYRIKKIQLEHLSGIFRVAEWELPQVGKLRVYFYRSSKDTAEKSYLFLLSLNSTSVRDVKREPGSDYVLSRAGASQIHWNVDTNSITLSPSVKTQ
jgi:hypothetical protein